MSELNEQALALREGIQEAEAKPLIRGAVAYKDPLTGKFLPGNKASVSPGRKAQAWLARKLEETFKDGKTRYELMTENMADIAMDTEPKYRKEAIWAYRALSERAYGMPLKDQSELDALAAGGGRTLVVVQMPSVPASEQHPLLVEHSELPPPTADELADQ